MERILIMEDDRVQGELLSLALEQEGRRIDHELCGRDAWTRLTSEPFDLLITDIFVKSGAEHVPDGGLLLISRMRTSVRGDYADALKRMPVIAISGSFGRGRLPDTHQLALDMGADVLMRKPVDLDELRGQVRLLLDGSPGRGPHSVNPGRGGRDHRLLDI